MLVLEGTLTAHKAKEKRRACCKLTFAKDRTGSKGAQVACEFRVRRVEYAGIFVRLCLDDCKNRLNRLCGFISQFFFFFGRHRMFPRFDGNDVLGFGI